MIRTTTPKAPLNSRNSDEFPHIAGHDQAFALLQNFGSDSRHRLRAEYRDGIDFASSSAFEFVLIEPV